MTRCVVTLARVRRASVSRVRARSAPLRRRQSLGKSGTSRACVCVCVGEGRTCEASDEVVANEEIGNRVLIAI